MSFSFFRSQRFAGYALDTGLFAQAGCFDAQFADTCSFLVFDFRAEARGDGRQFAAQFAQLVGGGPQFAQLLLAFRGAGAELTRLGLQALRVRDCDGAPLLQASGLDGEIFILGATRSLFCHGGRLLLLCIVKAAFQVIVHARRAIELRLRGTVPLFQSCKLRTDFRSGALCLFARGTQRFQLRGKPGRASFRICTLAFDRLKLGLLLRDGSAAAAIAACGAFNLEVPLRHPLFQAMHFRFRLPERRAVVGVLALGFAAFCLQGIEPLRQFTQFAAYGEKGSFKLRNFRRHRLKFDLRLAQFALQCQRSLAHAVCRRSP